MEYDKRVDEAVEAGELAFWAEVANVFGECESRNVDPTQFSGLRAQMILAVNEWVHLSMRDQRRWAFEFGAGYAVPYEIDEMVTASILHDDSCRARDRCPRFLHRCDSVSVVLRVDHPDIAQRMQRGCDTEGRNRFGVYVEGCNVRGPCVDSTDETIYDGDDLHTAIAAVNAAVVARDRIARYVARIYPDLNTVVNIAAIVERGILAGRTDRQIADSLVANSGLNGEQISDLLRLGHTGVL